MPITPEQEARLPAYARDELRRLRQNLRHAEERARIMEGGPEGSPVALRLSWSEGDRPLPPYAEFRVTLPGGTASVRLAEDTLEVMTTGASDGLQVRPRAANVVTIHLPERSA